MKNLDICNIPFSRYGAYISITANRGDSALTLHHVRRRCGEDEAYKLDILEQGVPAAYTLSAQPDCLTIHCDSGEVRAYIRDDNTAVFSSTGPQLRFRMTSGFGYGVDQGAGQYELIDVPGRLYSRIYVEKGSACLSGPMVQEGDLSWNDKPVDVRKNLTVSVDDNGLVAAICFPAEELKAIIGPINEAAEREEIRAQWQGFLQKMPPLSPDTSGEEAEFAEITWYNLWSSFARAEDVYKEDTILMSKKFMCSVWSWDHCFNALAIAGADRQKAFNQFMAPFHLQAASGALPDMWNPHQEVVRGVTKPPIHGWCFGKLMDRFDFSQEELTKVYTHLEKWTQWWMEYRDADKDGVPEYPMGCDSGWDNATVFDIGFYIESPDLSAFLVMQMKTLARISAKLGTGKEISWNTQAEELLHNLYAHCWNGQQFVAKQSGSHVCAKESTSLLVHLPIILGEHLQKEKAASIAKILEEHYLTAYGLSTEAAASPRYQADGYWRGPIWAPSTYLVVDGLRRAGFNTLAETIAKRYIRMSCHIAKGNYENFDALTGQGLRAPGYTWSASVYMLLLWEYGA